MREKERPRIAAIPPERAAPVALERLTQLPRGLARHTADASMFVPGDRIAERYRVERLLGRGGTGEVYEVEDVELEVRVALKALRFDLAGDPTALRGLKQEVLLARSITHPHVCRVYDLGRHGEADSAVWFLTMELLRGETLTNVLERQGRLSEGEALPLVMQMVAALSAAHRAGVVHLDFKSGNVIVANDDEGRARAIVTDFGLARLAAEEAGEGSRASSHHVLIGTPEYMSPEQVRGQKAGPPADIYALGVVLYELVTGKLPFIGRTAYESAERRLTEAPASPRSVVPELDEGWERVILRCLAREPFDRYERAENVVDALMGGAKELATARTGTSPRLRFKLPEERDGFVGRQSELTDLERRLASGARLVTLLGAAGMGKTRLATHFGWQSRAQWPGGVWFCDLAGARSLDEAASALASALGVPLGRVDPVIQLGHAIAGRGRCLVLLDTFEHLAEHAATLLGSWLERAPEARFVVTSRQRLKLPDEEIQTIEPLGIDAGVELFVQRAARQRPGFSLHQGEREEVREIVELVEGMPLAIELAAARVRVMAVGQVLERARERWRVLGGGGAGRHGSLLAAIDESWELLTPWERAAWAQCSVFEGGFTLEAAEAVLDLAAWPEAEWVVDELQSLVDKSLLRMWTLEPLVTGEAPTVRFGMYRSLQEYARKQLHALAPDAEHGAEARHGAWYAAYGAEAAIEAIEGPGGTARRRELELELENLLSTARSALARGDGTTATAAYCAAVTVLHLRGPLAQAIPLGLSILEGHLMDADRTRILQSLGNAERTCGMMSDARRHLEEALTLACAAGEREREGRIQYSLGTLKVAQGRIVEAREDLATALATLRDCGDRPFEAAALGTLGIVNHRLGRLEEGRAHCEAALAIHRELGNRRLESTTLGNLGTLHREQGRLDEARVHYEAALAIHRELGDRAYEGAILGNLGGLYHEQGRSSEARAHYEAALAHLREVGDRLTEGILLGNLGILHYEQGRLEEAHAPYETALTIARDLENRRLEGIVLGNLGNLYRAEGRVEDAGRQYASALDILRQCGDRRGEGIFLASLGALQRAQGRLESATESIARGEALLRDVGDPIELGKVLCARAELEHDRGDEAAARDALHAAEALAVQGSAGPESELGRMLSQVRRALGAE